MTQSGSTETIPEREAYRHPADGTTATMRALRQIGRRNITQDGMARTRSKAEIDAARVDADSAWAEHLAAQTAEARKTARLRAHRLARDAAPATQDGAAAPAATKRRRLEITAMPISERMPWQTRPARTPETARRIAGDGGGAPEPFL